MARLHCQYDSTLTRVYIPFLSICVKDFMQGFPDDSAYQISFGIFQKFATDCRLLFVISYTCSYTCFFCFCFFSLFKEKFGDMTSSSSLYNVLFNQKPVYSRLVYVQRTIVPKFKMKCPETPDASNFWVIYLLVIVYTAVYVPYTRLVKKKHPWKCLFWAEGKDNQPREMLFTHLPVALESVNYPDTLSKLLEKTSVTPKLNPAATLVTW